MARPKQQSQFDRMLRAARKQSSSTRRPWRHCTKRTAIRLTNAQKAERKRARDNEKQRYQQRLKEVFARIMDEATALKEEFGKHDIQWYLDEIMQTYRLKQKKRKVAPFRAFVSQQMKIINSDVPDGEARKKVPECIGEISKKWAAMSDEERTEATVNALKELEENRENRELASHNSSISVFHDVRTTMEDAKLMLQRLNSRTGVESIVITVWSNSEHFNPPEAWVTSERVASFFELAFKQTPHAIGSRLEGYCISGVEGVARNYVTETIEMKKELVKLIAEKLRIAGGKTNIPRMYYKNFDDHITAKYGIKIVNWPLEKFCCPSELSTRVDVQVLRNAWESGSTYFYKMTSAEWNEWDKKRFEDALASGTSTSPNEPNEPNEPTESPNNSPNDSQTTTPTTVAVAAAPTQPQSPEPPIPSQSPPPTITTQTQTTQPKKRGRKPKALTDSNQVNFVHTTAVTGVNGEVMLQKSTRKRRSDADKPRGPRKRQRLNNSEEGTTAA
ncbi:hypothetical protein VKT23_019886 [Stygiomarasmius scandens]|uniref:HMG box domain-containing protein n=1 Tax=Marasmiellus scandens TaxID=2682957 RepID=A0ABR1IKB2_9AGAR